MGDAGPDEYEVVGKLKGAGNEVRVKRCARFIIYVKDWEGGVNQPRQSPARVLASPHKS